MPTEFVEDLLPPHPVTADELWELPSQPNRIVGAKGMFGIDPAPKENIVAVNLFTADSAPAGPVASGGVRLSDMPRWSWRRLRLWGTRLRVPGVASPYTSHYLLYDRSNSSWLPVVNPVPSTGIAREHITEARFTARTVAAYLDSPVVPITWHQEDALLQGLLPIHPLTPDEVDALEDYPTVLGAVPLAQQRDTATVVALAIGSTWTPTLGGEAVMGFLGYNRKGSLWNLLDIGPIAHSWKTTTVLSTDRLAGDQGTMWVEEARNEVLDHADEQYGRAQVTTTDAALISPDALRRQVCPGIDIDVGPPNPDSTGVTG